MIKTHFKLFKPSLKITIILKEFDLYEVSFESKNIVIVFGLVFGLNNLNACDHLIFELLKLGIFLQEVLLLWEQFYLVVGANNKPAVRWEICGKTFDGSLKLKIIWIYLWMNFRPQKGHSWGFSPLWIFRWR